MARGKVIGIACGVLGAGIVSSAGACVTPTPPVEPPPRVFSERHSPTDYWVWIELRNVFTTDTSHDCSCGLGLGSALPTGMVIGEGVQIGVYNTSTMEIVRSITPFDDLAPSEASSMGWRDGPDAPDPLTGSPQVQNWFGFGGNIGVVTPGALGLNEIFVMCFQFDVPADFALTGTIPAQIGGGLGNPDGSPMFGVRENADSHLASYSNVFEFPIPAPGVVGVLLVAGAFGASRRRR